jgi:SRI (Set2 Rpb1 interacting) domain
MQITKSLLDKEQRKHVSYVELSEHSITGVKKWVKSYLAKLMEKKGE